MNDDRLDQLHELVTYACVTAIAAKTQVTVLRSLLAEKGIVIDDAAFDEAVLLAEKDEMADMPVWSEVLGELSMAYFEEPDNDDSESEADDSEGAGSSSTL